MEFTFDVNVSYFFFRRYNYVVARALLTDRCIAALEECVRRFPEHYKSYYRLANHYFRSKKYKNIEKARKYLLEDGGLFADRKASNFFSVRTTIMSLLS